MMGAVRKNGRARAREAARIEQANDAACLAVSEIAERLPDDLSVVHAVLGIVARVAMAIHDGDVPRAQGLINGICEAAKFEALNLAAGGRAS